MKNLNKRLTIIIVAVVAAMLAFYFYFKNNPTQGNKQIEIVVINDAATTTKYEIYTDQEYLYGIFENDEVDGLTYEVEDSGFGHMITTLNGLEADFDTDGAYWALFVNGEYGAYGIDEQPVTDGDSYTFEYLVSE